MEGSSLSLALKY